MRDLMLLFVRRFHGVRNSTLMMNAFYLMLSTLVVALSGFIFWIVITRSYDAASVGVATTFLSVSGLLSLLSLAGFDTTFVRFLPSSLHKNTYINSGIVVVTLLSTVLSLGFAVLAPIFMPQMALLHDLWSCLMFVFFTAATSLNTLTNAVFLAYKKARHIFTINILFSIAKVGLPFFVTEGSALTIFVLAGIAQLLGAILSLVWMKQKFGYGFGINIDLSTLKAVKKFSFSVYISSVLNLIPPTVLPLIIIHKIGPENAAYYYMAFTIASVLYTVAYAASQSAFAEGSHDESSMRQHIIKAAKIIGVVLLPAAAVTAIFSNVLLSIFGSEYQQGATLLRLFALSALPVAVYSVLGVIFKITKNLRGIVVMNVAYIVVIIFVSYTFITHAGINAVGWAWLFGNVVAACIGLRYLIPELFKKRRKGEGHGTTSSTRR